VAPFRPFLKPLSEIAARDFTAARRAVRRRACLSARAATPRHQQAQRQPARRHPHGADARGGGSRR
jgi:hypothetical protein